MTQGRALRASIVRAQLDFPNFDQERTATQQEKRKSICQKSVMAILDPRIPEKIAFRGAFNKRLVQENLSKIELLVLKIKVQFFINFLGPTSH